MADDQLMRQIRVLTEERLVLHRAAALPAGIAKTQHERLHQLERELDDSYKELRQRRAERDTNRFASYR